MSMEINQIRDNDISHPDLFSRVPFIIKKGDFKTGAFWPIIKNNMKFTGHRRYFMEFFLIALKPHENNNQALSNEILIKYRRASGS